MLNQKIVIEDYKILSFSTNFAWKSAESSVFTQHQWLTLISDVCSSILLLIGMGINIFLEKCKALVYCSIKNNLPPLLKYNMVELFLAAR